MANEYILCECNSSRHRKCRYSALQWCRSLYIVHGTHGPQRQLLAVVLNIACSMWSTSRELYICGRNMATEYILCECNSSRHHKCRQSALQCGVEVYIQSMEPMVSSVSCQLLYLMLHASMWSTSREFYICGQNMATEYYVKSGQTTTVAGFKMGRLDRDECVVWLSTSFDLYFASGRTEPSRPPHRL